VTPYAFISDCNPWFVFFADHRSRKCCIWDFRLAVEAGETDAVRKALKEVAFIDNGGYSKKKESAASRLDLRLLPLPTLIQT
jgi:hypothetical protein